MMLYQEAAAEPVSAQTLLATGSTSVSAEVFAVGLLSLHSFVTNRHGFAHCQEVATR